MAPQRGELAGCDAAQQEGPILRIADDRLGAGELLRKLALQPEQLPPGVVAAGQARRAGGREVARHRIVLGIEVGDVQLVIQHRQNEPRIVDHCDARAVRHRHDVGDVEVPRQVSQLLQRPFPDAVVGEMQIGRGRMGFAVPAPLLDDAAIRHQGHLGVGLADVENRDRIHAAILAQVGQGWRVGSSPSIPTPSRCRRSGRPRSPGRPASAAYR
jgi:hypothetical protein